MDPVLITNKCRGCKQAHVANAIVPRDDMCIGSLFDEDVPDNKVLGMFCKKCETAHKSTKSSLEVLSCGHQSIMHDEIRNPICFYPTCAEKSGKPQTEDDDCVFCAEILASSACAALKCGHIFHTNCLVSSWAYLFKTDSPTEPIKLTNSCCPLCKTPIEIDCEDYDELGSQLFSIKELRTHLQHLIVAQIQHENGSDDGMPSNPLEYGMAHYNFFHCEKCATVYCGGKRECGEAEVPVGTQMLCGGCRSCTTHGEDFMTFKCRFCCSEASWFCFGHTHFCEPCHDEAHELTTGNNNEFIVKAVPRCPGKDSCPLRLDHPAHGVEFGWCAACIAEETVDEFGAQLNLLYPTKMKSSSMFDIEDVSILDSLFKTEEIEQAAESEMVIGSLFDDDTPVGEDETDLLRIGNLFDAVVVTEEGPIVVGNLGLLFDVEEVEEPVVQGGLLDMEEAETGVIGSLFDEDEVVIGCLFDTEVHQQTALELTATYTTKESQQEHLPATPNAYLPKYNLTPNKLITLAHQLYCNWAHIAVVAATAALLNDLSCTAV